MNLKKWEIAACDKDLAAQIAQEYSLNPFAALLATSRGLQDKTEISEFFDEQSATLSDPFDLPDMEKAVDRLNIAIENNEHIVVFGDYDADGVTATALMVSYLQARGAYVDAYIPNRQTEGYGLSIEAVNTLKEMGAKLIVTVDNGVNAIEESLLAAEMGMEIIITDHHQPKTELPVAVAVVDPHIKGNYCGFKDFAGVGVAFKLICALDGGDPKDLLQEFGDLLAIGTIGDIVPLTGENRVLVKQGINIINKFPRTGIKALISITGLEKKNIKSSSIAYILAPRINAAGRMGSANRALELLMTENEELAENLALEINNENILRKIIEDEIILKVEAQLDLYPERKFDKIIVADGEKWHIGVIGIVASRLVEKYNRPCIIISKDEENAIGSGRSLEGFSLYNALNAVSNYLTHFGGHTLAAGLGVASDRIDEFRVALNQYASTIEMPFPVQKIDFKLNPQSISPDITDSLELFEPFGCGNAQPIFGLMGMKVEAIQPVSEGRHTRILVSKGEAKSAAIIFNTVTADFSVRKGDIIDLAVKLENNEYKNIRNVNIHVINLRLTMLNEEKLLNGIRTYEQFMRKESISKPQLDNLCPGREVFTAIYRFIKENNGKKLDLEVLCVQMNDDGGKIGASMLALDALLELELVNLTETGKYITNSVQKRADLEDSTILKRLRKCSVNKI